jgi:hypothetical protein
MQQFGGELNNSILVSFVPKTNKKYFTKTKFENQIFKKYNGKYIFKVINIKRAEETITKDLPRNVSGYFFQKERFNTKLSEIIFEGTLALSNNNKLTQLNRNVIGELDYEFPETSFKFKFIQSGSKYYLIPIEAIKINTPFISVLAYNNSYLEYIPLKGDLFKGNFLNISKTDISELFKGKDENTDLAVE